MRMMLATLTTVGLATAAVAQSGTLFGGKAAVSDVKTYWSEKRDGCQPMISFLLKNISAKDTGPIKFRLEVVDKDKGSVFARGSVVVLLSDVPPGHAKALTIGGDHVITPHDCLGDMHEAAFSTIHFAVRLTATASDDPAGIDVLEDEPMKDELIQPHD
jgi:hypothetical protein